VPVKNITGVCGHWAVSTSMWRHTPICPRARSHFYQPCLSVDVPTTMQAALATEWAETALEGSERALGTSVNLGVNGASHCR
jgi:hypothetical protein